MHIGIHFPQQPSFYDPTLLPQFLELYQTWKNLMPLQISSFKYHNVHHHLHMNPITIHLDDLLLYTVCIYRGWSKGNILYMRKA
jgi:hypothetical protein